MSRALTPKALRTRWALQALAAAARQRAGVPARPSARGVSAMGLRFPSALGLAAGFDRCGALAGRAGWLGLGSVDIGSLSAGSRELARSVHALRRARVEGPGPGMRAVHGVSLIKRASTPWPVAAGELMGMLRELHGLADYVTLNPGRDRPDPAVFAAVVAQLAAERDRLDFGRGRRLPLVAKLPSCWLGDEAVGMAMDLAAHGADGLLLSAEGVNVGHHLDVLRRVSQAVGPRVCLISVGGAASQGDLLQRIRAGAALVQVHAAARRSKRRPWLRAAVAGLARHHR